MNEQHREKAIIVGVVHARQNRELVGEYLDELSLLLDTAGADVVYRTIQERKAFDPAYLVGKGFSDHLADKTNELEADMIVFDDDLSPAQVKNLEARCKTKIMDRSGIILDIFANRAKTREAKTQVELAQLQYYLPRLTKMWTHLSRQAGSAGIGLKGPGETQLETDRRLVRRRITTLSRELVKITNQRNIRRQRRKEEFKVALMGYTNVGKSSLMNTLTTSDIYVENRLFATLDSTVRQLEHSGKENVLLIDTVGFVRKLPHHLVASFKSTLEETRDADLLLHVVDCSHPYFRDQMRVIEKVLKELEVDDRPTILVFNKIDLVQDKSTLSDLNQEFPQGLLVSAKRKLFTEDLKQEIVRRMKEQNIKADIQISLSDQKLLASIYEWAKVLDRKYEDGHVLLSIQFPTAYRNKYYQLIDGQEKKKDFHAK